MQPYHFVILLFVVCLAHSFYRVRITLRVEKFLKYRAALFTYFDSASEAFVGLAEASFEAGGAIKQFSMVIGESDAERADNKKEPIL